MQQLALKTEMTLTCFPLPPKGKVLRDYLPTGHIDSEMWDAIKVLPVSRLLPHLPACGGGYV